MLFVTSEPSTNLSSEPSVNLVVVERRLAGGARRRGGLRLTREAELAAFGIDPDEIALREIALEDFHRERIENPPLDGALQRPRPVYRIIPSSIRSCLADSLSSMRIFRSASRPMRRLS